MIPLASEEQLLLVELVRSVSAMRTETVMQTVKEVLKQPPAIAKDKVVVGLQSLSQFSQSFFDTHFLSPCSWSFMTLIFASPQKHLSLEVCMLQFFYAYVQR